MVKLKRENHHWWPECVSRYWAAEDGRVGWIKPDGITIRVLPESLGQTGNVHHVKFGHNPDASDIWNFSFENEFNAADSDFIRVIAWLEGLSRESIKGRDLSDRFLSQPASDEQLFALTESVVSLAVRSPRNREASVALQELVRGTLPSRERNMLIGMNMRQSQRIIADSIGSNAKFAVLFSTLKEFIYGDGFFHNVNAVINPPRSPKMLVPITPTMSVIISRPSSFTMQPRLSTLVLTADEVGQCNKTIQIYSRQALFFRSEVPSLIDEFACGKHMEYASTDNPIDNIISAMPGIPPRNMHCSNTEKSRSCRLGTRPLSRC
jgi:hypothetical protein